MHRKTDKNNPLGISFILFVFLMFPCSASAVLNLDTVTPSFGVCGQELEITLTGSGFDSNTRVVLVPEDVFLKAGTGKTMDMVLSDGLIYMAARDSNGLKIMDVRKPYSPRLLKFIGTPGEPWGIAVADNTAYIADGKAGLVAIDISDPHNANIIGSLRVPDYDSEILYPMFLSVAVAGNIAYVAQSLNYLRVVNIEASSFYRVIGTYELYGGKFNSASGPFDLIIKDNIAYVVGLEGLHIIEISDSANPNQIGYMDFSPINSINSTDISLSGNIAYIANNQYGMQIVDISDPRAPLHLSTVSEGRVGEEVKTIYNSGLTIKNNIAYIVDGREKCIWTADVSNPSQPFITERITPPGSPRDVIVEDSIAYIADNEFGLVIMPLPLEIQPEIINEKSMSITIPSSQIPGTYTIKVYNKTENSEKIGAVKFSEPVSKAIIVAGYESDSDSLRPFTNLCTNYAFRTLFYQGYSSENIYYLNDKDFDADGDGTNDNDAKVTKENLSHAVTKWADDATELIIYMTGHGSSDSFRLNPTQSISSAELNSILNNFQKSKAARVIFIYDACESGGFISNLLPDEDISLKQGRERILIASANGSAIFMKDGRHSFSYHFWSYIFRGDRLDDAFFFGKDMMADDQTDDDQTDKTARLDANGNGLSEETQDIKIAQSIIIGKGIVSAGSIPFIENGSADIDGDQILIQAGPVISDYDIAEIWAVITPACYTPGLPDEPVTDMPVVILTDSENDGIYSGTYSDAAKHGTYTVNIYAYDSKGFFSLPRTFEVIQENGISCEKGDINGDYIVNLEDAVIILRELAGTDTGMIRPDYTDSETDINKDGKAGLEEAVFILEKITGTKD